MVVGDSPADWPPSGYTEDIKVSNGRKIKFYTHVETGKKFYSKKEVTRYMNSKDTWHGVTQVNHQDNSCSKNNVSQDYQDKNCSDSNVSKVNYQDKNFSENNVSQIVEGTEKSNEWLPPGWIVELKTRKSGSHAGMAYKVYIDPSTRNKFYSKPEVSKYLKTKKLNDIAGEEQIHGTAELSSPNQKVSENSKDIGGQSRISKRQKSDTDGSSVKTICSNGIEEGSHSKQKTSQDSEEIEDPSCISKRQKSDNNRPTSKTSPAHRAGDFSNEKASQDSKENRAHSTLSKRKKRGIDSPSAKTHGAGEDFSDEKASQDSKKKGTAHSPLLKRKKRSTDSPSAKTVCSVAVECDSVDDLPPGWKKEVTIRQTDRGIRKDPLYMDPVHGYVFRSKKEVFRYLQTGDTSRCTRKSSKRNAASTIIDNSPTAEDASLKKFGCFETGRHLLATEEPKGGKSFVTCSPAQVESSKKQPDCSVSDPNTIITSILAEINDSHSCENINDDAEIGLARVTESVGVERLSPVSTPQSDLFPKKPLPENEQEKHSKTVTEQALNSRNTKSLKPGRRVSKRFAAHGPEVAADLDLGEHAFPAAVEKSASLSLPLNVGGQELLEQSVPTLEPGNSSRASLGDPASSDELPPGWKKEIKITKRAHGTRKDPLYIDPVHGYEFRSKKDAFRYLQTGDISRCAVRPTKRDLDTTMKVSSGSQHISGCLPKPTPALSASPSLPLDVGGQELLQQSVTTLEPGNSSWASLSDPASSDELPPGWKKEIKITKKTRGIRKDPLYIDPVHGYGFRSKKDVFRYLQTGDISRCAVRPAKRDLDTTMKESSVSQHISGCLPKPTPALSASPSLPLDVGGQELLQQSVTTREPGNSSRASLSDPASSDELPPGWKKEIKITKNARGIRKDPLYIDPVHGYEFRSKKDVFRYLQAGDISRCAVRPTKRDVDTILKESSPTTDASSKNLGLSVTKRQPSAVEGSRGGKRSVTYSPMVQTRSSKRQSESSASNPNTIVPSADVTAKHSYENVIENTEISLNAESAIRHSSGDTKVNAESVGDKRISAVSAPKSDVLPKQQLPENEEDKQINKETVEQSKLSRKKKVLTSGHRISKRLVGQNPELVADLDLGERALRAVVKKSASLGLPLNVCGEEILAQSKEPTVGTGNSDQVSLSRVASVDGVPPGSEKEKLAQNNVLIVGTGNSDQASLRRKASVDELPPSWEKEVLAQNKVPAVGTVLFDQASLSREASDDELPPGWTKEMLVQNKDPIVGTGYSDQASLSKEASVDELPPGWTKEMLARNEDPKVGTGNSHQAFLSREDSADELPPGWTKEMLAQNKNPAVKNFNYGQASLSREASVDDLPPGWTKEMLVQNKNPAVGTGNYQAYLSREASVDELPPGWTKEMLAQNKYPAVGTGNYQAYLSREASVDDLPPGWTKEMLARNKNPTVGTGNYQAYLSREASVDELPPGWTKEMLARNKNPTVGAGNCQAYLSREASVDDLPPGWTKEMLARTKNHAVGAGKSDQASLSREASLDELPPGWTKEMLAQNNNPTVRAGNSDEASMLRDASVDGLPPGWKKEMRIRKNTCGTKRDPYYTDPVHGYVFRSKKDVVRYLQTGEISKRAVRSTKRDAHSIMQDNSRSTHDANNKIGCSLTGRQLFGTEESKGRRCSVAHSLALQAGSPNEQSESSAFNAKSSVSSIVADLTEKGSRENVKEDADVRLDMEPETRHSSVSIDVKQLPGDEKEKRRNRGAPTQSRKFRNNKSFAPVRRVSKRFSQQNPEVVADLDLGERALRDVVKQNALSGIFLDVFGQELPLQTDLETGNFDPTSLSKEATSQGDPLGEFCPSVGRAFKEQKAAMELTSEKQDDEKRIWEDSQSAQISHGRNVPLKCQEVKERPTGGELVKEEQESRRRILENMQPSELAWESGKLPVEDKSTSERSTAVQGTKKRDHEKMQWQGSQLTEPSQRSGELNVENQSCREKQTGELGTESQDDQGRRLQAQLASYPFGDYWADPCLEFAFKTLTGAIPVEDTLAYQGPGQQEFNTSYTQADDGCFELPLFNTSSFYANDVPNHCAPTEEHVAKEQPPINLNHPFSLSENTSIPGCSAVGSQNPGLDTQAKDHQSKIKFQS